ncbi:hypothetical protein AVEN_64807-1 [Araneus ventricosus]|uniref:Integrase catalytic domain-containing protein n=1 Tax=Araneus ventricosus TaxID=182803 RepID=A0A4Y2GN12_ARAVE|nr:hypothetical protein AVEN_64807-1 [Araneus ventricosus]
MEKNSSSKRKTITNEVDKLLEKYYYDVEHPASFGGVAKLAKAAGVSIKLAREWLMKEDTYTLFKPTRYKFLRRKTLAYGIGDLIQSDLVDLSKVSRQNRGVNFLSTSIDAFSKKAYVLTLKDKSAKMMLEAMKKLLKQAKPIVNLQTDEGKEFYNKQVQQLLKKKYN